MPESSLARSSESDQQYRFLNGRVVVSRQFILENCYAKASDVCVLTSSIVEGMGNRYSDLDVYVICQERPRVKEIEIEKHHRVLLDDRRIVAADSRSSIGDEEEVFLIHTALPGSEVKVDVEFRTWEEVDGIRSEFEEIFRYAVQNLELLTRVLTDREASFLHRLGRGVPIYNAQAFERLRSQIDPSKLAYLCYRWIASDFSVLLDLAGAYHNGEFDRCVDLCRGNVLREMQAFLHLHGVTNPDPKWMLFYLHRVLEEDGDLKKRFFDFYYLLETGSETLDRRYCRRSLEFVDELHMRSRPLLNANPLVPSGAQAVKILARRYAGEGREDRFATLERMYRSRVYEEPGFSSRWLLDSAEKPLSGRGRRPRAG